MVASSQQYKLIWFQSFTILLPFIFLLFFIYKKLYTEHSPRKNLPPSPPKLPILGNIHQLGVYPHHSLHSLSQKYGELMLIHLGHAPYLVVSSSNAAREIMKTHDLTFSNRPQTLTLQKLFYKGKDVATAQYGEYWRQMRRICVLHLLSNKRVQSFRSVREEETAFLMEKIQKLTPLQSPINLTDMLRTLTKQVICRVAFGSSYSGNKGDTKFQKLLEELLELVGGVRVSDHIPWLGWTSQLDGWDARVNRVFKELDEFLEQIVNEHRDHLNQHQKDDLKDEKVADDEQVKDFVDVLLEVQKDKASGLLIDRDGIKALMLDVFSGGSDTTSTVLEWTVTELLRHPTIMEELKREVRGITGQKSDVNEDDVLQMKYLKAVIKETLRLHPPVPLTGRMSIRCTTVNGYEIPAGTGVIINMWAIHRDPASWEDPEIFNPKRFLKSSVDFRGQDFQYTPFGAGRRMCPGISFTIAINELVLANIMHKFDLELPGGAKGETLDMSESIGITKHRKTPLLAIATTHNFI